MIHQNDKISRKEKHNYISIIRVNIRTDIMSYLYYYCLLPETVNFEKPNSLKSIVQYYDFFQFIEEESLIVREHIQFYPYITFSFLNDEEKSEVAKKRSDMESLLQQI